MIKRSVIMILSMIAATMASEKNDLPPPDAPRKGRLQILESGSDGQKHWVFDDSESDDVD